VGPKSLPEYRPENWNWARGDSCSTGFSIPSELPVPLGNLKPIRFYSIHVEELIQIEERQAEVREGGAQMGIDINCSGGNCEQAGLAVLPP